MSPEDKVKIRALLQKPWNPYIQRHASLTEKARLVNEYTLRLHAGWSKSSRMVDVYTHELGGESSKELLKAYGIINNDGPEKNLLATRICPMCAEPNKPDARFCTNKTCQLALTIDAYTERKEQEEKAIEDLARTKDRIAKEWEEMRGMMDKDHRRFFESRGRSWQEVEDASADMGAQLVKVIAEAVKQGLEPEELAQGFKAKWPELSRRMFGAKEKVGQ